MPGLPGAYGIGQPFTYTQENMNILKNEVAELKKDK